MLLSITDYIITQVILTFWLVLTYDLLEDRCTIDVIIAKFFPSCFKMVECFKNLDHILHDLAKYKVQEVLSRYWTEQQVERRKLMFMFPKLTQKILE